MSIIYKTLQSLFQTYMHNTNTAVDRERLGDFLVKFREPDPSDLVTELSHTDHCVCFILYWEAQDISEITRTTQ